jgi:hypothetical protein
MLEIICNPLLRSNLGFLAKNYFGSVALSILPLIPGIAAAIIWTVPRKAEAASSKRLCRLSSDSEDL